MAKSKKRQNGGGGGSVSTPDRIAARAYELYLARGGEDGQAWDDWLAAERELTETEQHARDDRHE